MRLNALGGLPFTVRAHENAVGGAVIQLSIGPLQFSLVESEGLRLANGIVDAIERHRQRRERTKQL